MQNDVTSLRDTIVPKSDQLNAEQLLAGPITITITDVRRGVSDEQPLVISYEGDSGRPYKPCKSMRKVLIFAWGDNGLEWIGKSMTLFCDPEVKFGGVKVGGIRISHMSHIERDVNVSLTATKGRKEPFTIKRLVVQQPAKPSAPAVDVDAYKASLEARLPDGLDAFKAAWNGLPPAARKALGAAYRDQCAAKATEFDAARQQPEPEPEAEPAPADSGDMF